MRCANNREMKRLIGSALLVLFQASVVLAAPVKLDRLEASVNSLIILQSDVDRFRKVEPLRSQLDPLYSGTRVAQLGDKAGDRDIIEFLIDEKLISQEFPVNDSEVEQEINSIQAGNKIDRNSLKSALAQQGFSFADYFELIRTSSSKRNLIDRDIRTKVNISDADIKNYYYNRYASANSAATRSYKLRLIFISRNTYKSEAAAREAAQRAHQAILAGEAFEEVAKRVSDDANASTGGDLGTMTEDQMAPAIREQVKKLNIGGVSDVFGTPANGYYILKLEDVQSNDSAHFDKTKEEIRNHLIAAEYQHQISLWLDRQRQKAFIHKAGEQSLMGIPATGN